jgi:hypothetical protein
MGLRKLLRSAAPTCGEVGCHLELTKTSENCFEIGMEDSVTPLVYFMKQFLLANTVDRPINDF